MGLHRGYNTTEFRRPSGFHFEYCDLSIPTKLELPREDVDLLIDVAPELLHEDPDFHLLLQDLDARKLDASWLTNHMANPRFQDCRECHDHPFEP